MLTLLALLVLLAVAGVAWLFWSGRLGRGRVASVPPRWPVVVSTIAGGGAPGAANGFVSEALFAEPFGGSRLAGFVLIWTALLLYSADGWRVARRAATA